MHRLEVYPDESGRWRWRKIEVGNKAIIAVSGEDFDSKSNAVRAALDANPEVAEVEDGSDTR